VVGGVALLDILDVRKHEATLVHQAVRHEPAAERGRDNFNRLKDFRTETTVSQKMA